MDSLLSNEDLFASAGRYGYLHPSYAESFAEVGEVRHLRRSGSWLLTRPIEGSDRRDAVVGYPRLISRDWVGLVEDLAARGTADSPVFPPYRDPAARLGP